MFFCEMQLLIQNEYNTQWLNFVWVLYMFCVYNLVTLCTYFCTNNQVSSPRSPQIPGGRLWLWFCARNSLYKTLNNPDACCLSTRLLNDSVIYVYLRHLSTHQPSQDAPSDGTDAAAELKAKTVEHRPQGDGHELPFNHLQVPCCWRACLRKARRPRG